MNCKFFKRLFLFGFQTGIRTTNQKYCQKWQESQQKSHLNYKVNLFNATMTIKAFSRDDTHEFFRMAKDEETSTTRQCP